MKKFGTSLALAILLGFALTNLAVAATPDLRGIWTGTAKKITGIKCSNVPVSLDILTQCGMLFEGLITIGTQNISVVGRFYNNEITLKGSYGAYGFATISGNYTTNPSPRIVVMSVMLMGGTVNDYYDSEYSVFPLIKKP